MPSSDAANPLDSVRRVTDAKTMRALAHPVRISLLELLMIDGPMTATMAGERIGESPTTCSFHLRQLSKYGFVEEAGGGAGRNRPWRVTSIGMTMGEEGVDPQADLAATALQRMFRERHLRRLQHWRETRAGYPKEWREVGREDQYAFWATAKELGELEAELARVLMRYVDRLADRSARPPGSRAVEVLQVIFPLDLENLDDGEAGSRPGYG